MEYISNAFSLNMLDVTASTTLVVNRVTVADVKKHLPLKSFVGHQATADLLTKLLDTQIQFNRDELKLYPGDTLFIFQLMTRLPEGKVLTIDELQTLQYKWYAVTVL
ncbi:MAG: DUF1874 domain-containing protein [Conexivisphaerales archaeon]